MLRYVLFEEDDQFRPRAIGVYTDTRAHIAMVDALSDFLRIMDRREIRYKIHCYAKDGTSAMSSVSAQRVVVCVNGKDTHQFWLEQLEFSMREKEEERCFSKVQRKRYRAELTEYLRESDLLCHEAVEKILDLMQEEDDPEISRSDWMKECVQTYQKRYSFLQSEEFKKKVLALRTAIDDLIDQEPSEFEAYSDEEEFFAEIHNMDQALDNFLPENYFRDAPSGTADSSNSDNASSSSLEA